MTAHHDAELAAILTTLEATGLVEQYTDEDGKPSMRLTPRGTQVGRALAMSRDAATTDDVLAALLDDAQAGPRSD